MSGVPTIGWHCTLPGVGHSICSLNNSRCKMRPALELRKEIQEEPWKTEVGRRA